MIGILTNVLSAATSICSTIGNALGSVGPFISNMAKTISPYVDKVGTFLDIAGTLLKVFQPNDKAENFGEAMRQSSKKPDDFDDINSYIDHLRDEIKSGNIDLNIERSEEDKLANKFMGYGLMLQGVNEKCDLTKGDIIIWGALCEKMGDNKITQDEAVSVIQNIGKSEIHSDDVSKYISGDKIESGANKSEISSIIENGLKDANPNMSSEEISAKFDELIKN